MNIDLRIMCLILSLPSLWLGSVAYSKSTAFSVEIKEKPNPILLAESRELTCQELVERESIQRFQVHQTLPIGLGFTVNGWISFWDLGVWKAKKTFDFGISGSVFSKWYNRKPLVVISDSMSVLVMDPQTDRIIIELPLAFDSKIAKKKPAANKHCDEDCLHQDPTFISADISPDDRLLVVAARNGLFIWDLSNFRLIQKIPFSLNANAVSVLWETGEIVVDSDDGPIMIKPKKSGDTLTSSNSFIPAYELHKTSEADVLQICKQKRIFAMGHQGSAKIHDLNTGKILKSLPFGGDQDARVANMDFTPDCSRIAYSISNGSQGKGGVFVVDVATAKLISSIEADKIVNGGFFDRGSKIFTAKSNGQISFFDVKTKRLIKTIKQDLSSYAKKSKCMD